MIQWSQGNQSGYVFCRFELVFLSAGFLVAVPRLEGLGLVSFLAAFIP